MEFRHRDVRHHIPPGDYVYSRHFGGDHSARDRSCTRLPDARTAAKCAAYFGHVFRFGKNAICSGGAQPNKCPFKTRPWAGGWLPTLLHRRLPSLPRRFADSRGRGNTCANHGGPSATTAALRHCSESRPHENGDEIFSNRVPPKPTVMHEDAAIWADKKTKHSPQAFCFGDFDMDCCRGDGWPGPRAGECRMSLPEN